VKESGNFVKGATTNSASICRAPELYVASAQTSGGTKFYSRQARLWTGAAQFLVGV